LAALKQGRSEVKTSVKQVSRERLTRWAAPTGRLAGERLERQDGRPQAVVSAALRAHLSRKAKERWAKVHAAKEKPESSRTNASKVDVATWRPLQYFARAACLF